MSRFFLFDALAIASFAFLARVAHRSEDVPLSVASWLSTLWPFLLGVCVAWVFIVVGRLSPRKVAPAGLTVWFVTVLIGLGVWAIRNGSLPHWSFIIVASLSSGVLLIGWRLLFARRRTDRVQ